MMMMMGKKNIPENNLAAEGLTVEGFTPTDHDHGSHDHGNYDHGNYDHGNYDHSGHDHGGNPFAHAALSGVPYTSYLDFSANINPLGMPKSAIRAARKALAELSGHYPEPTYHELRQAAAAAWEVPAENIVAGNGAGELLDATCRLAAWQEAVVFTPTYSEYARAARRAGLPVRCLPAFHPDHLPSSSLLKELPTPELKPRSLIFVCQPNNPTGTLVSREALAVLARIAAQKEGLLVVDESFLAFCPEEAACSSLPLLFSGLPVLVIRSLTKIYGMPGLRLGLSIAAPETAKALQAALPPWNVNSVAAAAGSAALVEREFLTLTRERLTRWRVRLVKKLTSAAAGGTLLQPLPAAANFLLTKITSEHWSSPQLTAALAKELVLVRDCRSFPELGERYIRLAVRRPADQDRLLAALTRLTVRPEP